MKKGDIIVLNEDNKSIESIGRVAPALSRLSRFHLYKILKTNNNESSITLSLRSILGFNYGIFSDCAKLADKYDLKDYLQYIFTSEKSYIKCESREESIKLCKIIKQIIYIETQTTYKDVCFYSGNNIWVSSVSNIEILKKNNYFVLNYKDIEYMIIKIYGKV